MLARIETYGIAFTQQNRRRKHTQIENDRNPYEQQKLCINSNFELKPNPYSVKTGPNFLSVSLGPRCPCLSFIKKNLLT